jgi:Kef-type K+ transport system membrane component KefB
MKLFLLLSIGVLLGPSFGKIVYPESFSGFISLCANMFLFVAGLELSLRKTKECLPQALRLTFGAFALPFVVGLLTAWILFHTNDGLSFTNQSWLFLAIALSVSALPVAVQILKDLNLYQTDIGRLIISTATLCDIIAWVGFAFLLSGNGLGSWIKSHLPVFLFFAGLGLSDFKFWKKSWTAGLEKMSKWIFGPVFFICIGWKINLLTHFNLTQVLIVFTTACVSKFFGSYFMAKYLGHSHKQSTLIGLALNSRGAVEILIASLALRQGLIDETLFTTLIVVAVGTSLLPEPLTHLLKLTKE